MKWFAGFSVMAGLSQSAWSAASASATSYTAGAAQPASLLAYSLQTLLVLLFIIALIVFAARLLRRFSLSPTGASSHLRVVSGVMVGQRERVVVVECGETWLVLGVAGQTINVLHTLPRPADAPKVEAPAMAFPDWLRRALDNYRSGGKA